MEAEEYVLGDSIYVLHVQPVIQLHHLLLHYYVTTSFILETQMGKKSKTVKDIRNSGSIAVNVWLLWIADKGNE